MIKAYAALEPKGKLQPFEYNPGPLKVDEVEIEVESCGLCHSDLSMINNDWGGTRYPMVPGHEVIGTVKAVGDQVKRLSVGDSVGLGWHSGYCMTCHSCCSGDHNLCASAQPTIVGHHGGFAEQVRASAPSVVKLPDGLDKESAGPLFCGGVTVFSPLLELGVKPTDRVGVVGIGGLGHLALKFLKAWGCEVTAFTSSDKKKTEAIELGAHHTIDSRDTSAINKASGQFDLLIVTVNVKLNWDAYVQTLRPKGRLHFVGAVLEPLDCALFPLLMKQRSISASPVGSPTAIAMMLEFAARHSIKPTIEEFAMSEVNDAIEHLKSGQAHYRIVLCR